MLNETKYETTYSKLVGLQSHYSDFHKDVYGFRPRSMSDAQWNSEAWLEAAIAALTVESKVVWEQEEAEEKARARALEAKIVELIAVGAKTRANAIRWIADAEDVNDDMEYLCFKLGVPYGYFKEAA